MLAVAAKEDADKSSLSFVHIVKNDDSKTHQHQHNIGGKNFNEESEIVDKNKVTDSEEHNICDHMHGDVVGESELSDEYEFE